MADSVKRLIFPAGIRLHQDLIDFLKAKGFTFLTVLNDVPPTAKQEELILIASGELKRSGIEIRNGDLTITVGGMGLGSRWLAVLEAVEVFISKKPYVILPRHEGRNAEFTCWLGEETVDFPA